MNKFLFIILSIFSSGAIASLCDSLSAQNFPNLNLTEQRGSPKLYGTSLGCFKENEHVNYGGPDSVIYGVDVTLILEDGRRWSTIPNFIAVLPEGFQVGSYSREMILAPLIEEYSDSLSQSEQIELTQLYNDLLLGNFTADPEETINKQQALRNHLIQKDKSLKMKALAEAVRIGGFGEGSRDIEAAPPDEIRMTIEKTRNRYEVDWNINPADGGSESDEANIDYFDYLQLLFPDLLPSVTDMVNLGPLGTVTLVTNLFLANSFEYMAMQAANLSTTYLRIANDPPDKEIYKLPARNQKLSSSVFKQKISELNYYFGLDDDYLFEMEKSLDLLDSLGKRNDLLSCSLVAYEKFQYASGLGNSDDIELFSIIHDDCYIRYQIETYIYESKEDLFLATIAQGLDSTEGLYDLTMESLLEYDQNISGDMFNFESEYFSYRDSTLGDKSKIYDHMNLNNNFYELIHGDSEVEVSEPTTFTLISIICLFLYVNKRSTS